VDPTNPEEAGQCIANWCQHPDEAQAAGENGRQAIFNKYNWETLADQLVDVYHSLLVTAQAANAA
jgi:glycosyltransferase involved in cell wall biosynthesis